MPATITASEKNLDTVFSKTYSFGIPRYQRPYAWEREQVSDMLNDLIEAFDQNREEPYFLGSVVLIEDDEPRSQVVDGQQRLTTLTMLFCVLRDISTNMDTITQLDGVVSEVANRIRGTGVEFRLAIRELDREFFEQNVQARGKTKDFLDIVDRSSFSDVQNRMFENVKYLRDELLKHEEQLREDLAGYIIQNCYLVVVSATDRGSAHRIFSVMNDRGLDLSPTDVLKSDVLGDLPSVLEETYATKWEGIEVDLGREDFRDLFAHIRMIYRKEKQRRGTLQDEFRDTVLAGISSQHFVDEILDPYATVYADVTGASYGGAIDSDDINSLLRCLNRLDNFDWIPPVMSYFHRNGGNQSGILSFTRDLERLAYGLFIKRADINERISRYAQVLHMIEQEGDLFSEGAPLQLSSEEKTDILKRLDGEIYNQPRIPMPLLLRLDSLLADTGATYSHKVISIEHVLPQNPSEGSNWLDIFPDAEHRHHWVHRLANLVLLSRRKNTRASNWDFTRKKQEYFLRNGVTPFVLTSQVANETDWTMDVLERRQRELVNAFKKEWRLG